MPTRLLAAFLCTLVYAIIRYAGFGHVSLAHLPAYIMNKAIAMTAVEALLMASLGILRGRKGEARFWTQASSRLVFVHVLMSLAILSKGYWGSFFEGDRMSLIGELVVLMGALGTYCSWRLQAARVAPSARRALMILACALVGGHLFAMGYHDTTQVAKWNGGLPPMSFLSFIMIVSGLVALLVRQEAGAAPWAVRTERAM